VGAIIVFSAKNLVSKEMMDLSDTSSPQGSGSSNLKRSFNNRKAPKVIKWDEEVIAAHDKERGTRYAVQPNEF
jgi:hypothetical protein